MSKRMLTELAVALTLSSLALAGAARAETTKLNADLKGASESPAVDSKGTGKGEFTFDDKTYELKWTVTYDGLSSPPTAAHIHGPAAPGANAGVVVPLGDVSKSPITGSAKLTEEQEKDLLDGKYYVNIHTATAPGGEIRGQITK
jgi:hypothetical protein